MVSILDKAYKILDGKSRIKKKNAFYMLSDEENSISPIVWGPIKNPVSLFGHAIASSQTDKIRWIN